MKRQSKAEEALRRQVKVLDEKIKIIREQINDLNQQLMAHTDITDQIESEINNLRRAREAASKRLSP